MNKREAKKLFLLKIILAVILLSSLILSIVPNVSAKVEMVQDCAALPKESLDCFANDVYGKGHHCGVTGCEVNTGLDVLVEDCGSKGCNPVGGAHCMKCDNTDTSCGDTYCTNCAALPAINLYCSPLDNDLRGNYFKCDNGACVPETRNREVQSCGGNCNTVGGTAHCPICTNTDASCGDMSCSNCNNVAPTSLACLGNGLRGFYSKCEVPRNGVGSCVTRDVRWNLPNSAPCPNGCANGACLPCGASGSRCFYPIGSPSCYDCCNGITYSGFLGTSTTCT
ncbi:MAG: hypothetical protein Q7S06_02490 [Nanoarchaeota archaeon]|nr:hypothetical protein [Nanoarchaeota archaeon]